MKYIKNIIAFLFVILACVTYGAVAAPINGVPAYVMIAPSGRSSVLIGTDHVPLDGLMQPSTGVLDGKRIFVTEHVMSPADNSALQWVLLRDSLPVGLTLTERASHLSPKRMDTYVKRSACAHFSEDQARRLLMLPSIQNANSLAYTVCGTQARDSRDDLLLYAARARSLQFDTLEDDDIQEARRLLIPESIAEKVFFGF